MWNGVKVAGGVLIVVAIFLGLALLGALWTYGAIWVADKVYPWLATLNGLTLTFAVVVLLPLALFRKTRGFSGVGLVVSSYVFGATLWVWALLLTAALWGFVGVFVGLAMAGIGIVPIAMLAALFKGTWSMLGELVLVTAFTLGTRLGGLALVSNAESHSAERPNEA